MTVTEAAQLLGLSPRTLQEQIARGRIKATRCPGFIPVQLCDECGSVVSR